MAGTSLSRKETGRRYNLVKSLPTKDDVTVALAEMSLAHYIRQAWHIVEPKKPLMWNWHLDAICDHLQAVSRGEIHYLLINVPPRHTKSLTVMVFWPTWEWGPAGMPHLRYICSSYSFALSTRDAVKAKRIMASPWYRERWGDQFVAPYDTDQKIRYDNDAGGYRVATSVGGMGTGEGGDRVMVDDPHNVTRVESDVQRESTLLWWDESMSTRVDNEDTGAYVIIGQRTHSLDLSGHIIEKGENKEIDLVRLILPARYEKERELKLSTKTPLLFKDPRTEDGEPLDKSRYPERKLTKLEKRMTEYARASQLQQRPSPRGGGMFKVECFKILPKMPHASMIDSSVRYWDKACLIKGTKIKTSVGDVNIENIIPGQFVLTRSGYKKVKRAWLSKYADKLTSVIFSDGRVVTGTPDHVFFTKNGSEVELSNLSANDRVIRWEDQEIQTWKLGTFKEEGMQDNREKGTSIAMNGTRRIRSMFIGLFTKMFGKQNMALSPKVIISTTRTTIGMITRIRLLEVDQFSGIEGFMQKICCLKLLWQIQNIERKHMELFNAECKQGKSSLVRMRTARTYFLLKAFEQNIVRNADKKEPWLEIEIESGIGAIKDVPTFDLSVEGQPEFFANGILVHNSTEGGGCLSAGVLMHRMKKIFIGPRFIVESVVFGQWSSGKREARIKQTAEVDGTGTYVWVEQEPGSGGKESAENTVINLAGYKIHAERVTGSKEVRAEPYSAQVEAGNVGLVQGSWNQEFLDQHELFPSGSRFKDLPDAASGAFNKLVLQAPKKAGTWGR